MNIEDFSCGSNGLCRSRPVCYTHPVILGYHMCLSSPIHCSCFFQLLKQRFLLYAACPIVCCNSRPINHHHHHLNDLNDLCARGEFPTAPGAPLSLNRPPRMFGVLAQKAQIYTLGIIRFDGMLMHCP